MADKIEEKLPGVLKNVPLKDYTTYKIGGLAKYFFITESKEDLMRVLQALKNSKLPVFVLGGGSNLLISDRGFNGLVIKISNFKFQISNSNKVYTDAGAELSKLAHFTAEQGLSGLEWAAGIPGTVGGAIYGHAQAFGTKISDAIKTVEVINLKTLALKNFTKKQCQFSLKNSIFKKNKNLVIVSAVLEFKKGDRVQIKNKIEEFLDYRKTRHPIDFPSAGSTFINPEVKIKNKKLLEKFPELNEFNKKGVIPAGYLIEKFGLSGKKIGNAQISEKHANFIINLGGAKSKDVLSLMGLAQKSVRDTFGIELEPEVQLIGFK